MDNNIFSFAKKELSQDAVLCWILNWIKYPQSELHDLSKDLFRILGVESVDVNQDITIKQQLNKADIVVTLHGQKIILIIEDKVYSSEHDNQIQEYTKIFQEITTQEKLLNNKSQVPYDVKSVYLKTGYYYDADKVVKADYKVNADQLYAVVSNNKYRNKSEILDAFVEHLESIMKYYDDYKDFRKKYEEGGFYISRETIAQQSLMRTLFPEKLWDGKSYVFRVRNGSSSGRPWTEANICEDIQHENSSDNYHFFWRIDTNKTGPYLSLRLYDYFDKKNEKVLNRHNELYDKYIEKCRCIFDELQDKIELRWDDVNDGYRGNYVEASLLTIKLEDYLNNWDLKGTSLIRDVNCITDNFIKGLN